MPLDFSKGFELPSTFNPNQISNTPGQGPGSGSGVQSAQDAQQNQQYANSSLLGRSPQFTGDPLAILHSFFPEASLGELSNYTSFVSPISEDLYAAADEDDPRYTQMFEEEAGFVSERYSADRRKGQTSLFGAKEEFRGSAGKRAGIGLGRDFFKNISEEGGRYSQELAQGYGKSLYDIKTGIVDEISRNKLLLAQAEAERRRSYMDLARLGEFLVEDPNREKTYYSGLPQNLQDQINEYYQNQEGYPG
tara:strand:+ start:1277 stop:2023 length:747 start_codon:yes stop_codon:yes gene_type:complete